MALLVTAIIWKGTPATGILRRRKQKSPAREISGQASRKNAGGIVLTVGEVLVKLQKKK